MKVISLNKYLFPIGLAAILTFLIFIIAPPVNQRLNIKLVDTKLCNKNQFYFYEDLNNDGITEEYRTFNNSKGSAAIDGSFMNRKYLDQWNFKGTHLHKHLIHFSDVNNDGLNDITLITCHNDTLLLHAFNPISNELFIKNFPLIRIQDKNDFFPNIVGCRDINGNGHTEVLIGLHAGYNLQPRKILAFEYATQTLKMTPLTGCVPGIMEIRDINNDGKLEILTGGYSPGNYKVPVPYSDNSVWSMIFDHNLELLGKPIEFPFQYGVALNSFFPEENGNYSVISLIIDQKGNENWMYKSDLNGNKIAEIKLPDFLEERCQLLNDKENSGNIYFYNPKTGYQSIDSDFNFINKLKPTKKHFPYLRFHADIDRDGKADYFSAPENNGIYFTKSLFKKPIFLKLPIYKRPGQYKYSLPATNDNRYNFYLQVDAQGFYIKYPKNKYYWLRYIIYLGTFMGLFSLIELIRWQQRTTSEKKIKRERELVEWQLQSVRNQLDPHFTFNALNAIGSAIYKEKKEVAYDIFTQFSHLFRKSLEDSNKLTRTLHDELEFVKNYISIQKFRFEGVFDFKIEAGKGVDKYVKIPKMVIQTFAENAIYHGLIPKKQNGMLTINVNQDEKYLTVIIEDNGVGRHAKVKQKKSTGKGIELMQNYLDLLNKNNNNEQLSYKVIDLFEGEKPVGTKVELIIPLKFKYN